MNRFFSWWRDDFDRPFMLLLFTGGVEICAHQWLAFWALMVMCCIYHAAGMLRDEINALNLEVQVRHMPSVIVRKSPVQSAHDEIARMAEFCESVQRCEFCHGQGWALPEAAPAAIEIRGAEPCVHCRGAGLTPKRKN